MSKYCYIFLCVLLIPSAGSYSQTDTYIVGPVTFSSGLNNEFSPVFYKGGIVFCSDKSDNSLVSFENDQSRLFKIFYVTKRGTSGWNHPRILSREITTKFNDGPVTFNEAGNIIYYSRNNSIENPMKNITDTSNKLGIYSAELSKGIWKSIKPFKFNDPLYSFYTPALTSDGKRIYFSSDKPGGFGGMDLYYCDMLNNEWDKPVNLGPLINTPKNESYPYAGRDGKLYFASDGHKGFGWKDLYYTQEINNEWMAPVHLDSAINSPADDFGLCIDSANGNGYFSTNRRKTDDIFSFSLLPVEFSECDSIKENKYCFTFYDEQQQLIDTIPVIYKWDFGDGIIRLGKEVSHCFPGPGSYPVRLTIIDGLTGDTVAQQAGFTAELENIEQGNINSYDIGIVDKSISFEGLISDLKGLRITDYFWDSGDGFKPGGSLLARTFNRSGTYLIKLGLIGEKDSLGVIPKVCVIKKIRIYDSYSKLKSEGKGADIIEKSDSVSKKMQVMQVRIYFMDDLSAEERSNIEGSLKKSWKQSISFDKYGINPGSFQYLDNILEVLKANPDIILEIALHSVNEGIKESRMKVPEVLAQELSFYFKYKGAETDRINSKGYNFSAPFSEPSGSVEVFNDGEIDFIFMKK
jgi:hypothetical protein